MAPKMLDSYPGDLKTRSYSVVDFTENKQFIHSYQNKYLPLNLLKRAVEAGVVGNDVKLLFERGIIVNRATLQATLIIFGHKQTEKATLRESYAKDT